MTDWVMIQEALVHSPRHCRYHNANFGASGWTGPERESLPRCDSCKQPWRIAQALNALDRLVRGADKAALTAPPDEKPVYLLWSGNHRAWWKSGGWGYTADRDEAGRFTRSEALKYVARSADGGNLEHATRMVHQGDREDP